MNAKLSLWGIILLVWVVGGSLLIRNLCCGLTGPSFEVFDGNYSIGKASSGIVFSLGNSTPEVPEPAKDVLLKVSKYLNDHRDKVLLIDGHFVEKGSKKETSSLGLLRAQKLELIMETIGVDKNKTILSESSSPTVTQNNQQVFGAIKMAVTTIPFYFLEAKDQDNFAVQPVENITFKHSSFAIEPPPTTAIMNEFERLATYLKGHPERRLILTGLYHPDEKNTSMLPDLGLARANQIKNILQKFEVASDQIEVISQSATSLIFPGNYLYGGAIYAFENTEANPTSYEKNKEVVAKLEEELKIEKIILYFGNDEKTVILTPEQRDYFSKLINYLDNRTGAKVVVEGHTSNTGTKQHNLELSEQRAAFVKAYLVENGLNADQILTVGKGTSDPLADNDTEEGQAKNRRTVIYIKK